MTEHAGPVSSRTWTLEVTVSVAGRYRRLGDCFPSVDYFERRQLPFIVAINVFDDAPRYAAEDVRIALDLDPNVPAMLCDARQRDSVKDVLITLVQHVLAAGPRDGQRASGDPGAVGQHGAVG